MENNSSLDLHTNEFNDPINNLIYSATIKYFPPAFVQWTKSKAKINLSNQCGTNHLVVRYSKCFESQRQFPIAHNFVEGDIYL